MKKVFTKDAPKPIGPYSQAVMYGNLVFVSGQLGIDEHGKLAGNPEEQAKVALGNIEKILNSAGASKCSIVRLTLFLKRMSDFECVNRICEEFFSECPVYPSRVTVGVSDLPLNAYIEVECIACVG